jgi:GT2 family glycosyltransferase
MNKVLSIVIPVWNKWNFTKACLEDLAQLPEDHEIIVVDNGSTDDTSNNLLANKRIIYHRNTENLGFAKACNIGYSLATASNVLFLNNDIRVKSNHENWTHELISLSESNWLVGPTMGELDNNLSFKQEANRMLLGKNTYMSGWCLCASKNTWEKLRILRAPDDPSVVPQIFSEEFGLAYFEDTDLGFRANRLKMDRFVVEIPVVHFGKQTSGQLNTHKLYTAARQIFVKKWATNK